MATRSARCQRIGVPALSFLVLFSLLCRVAHGQQSPAPQAQPKQPTNDANSFVCPDPKAKLACDSFLELKKAKDPTLENSLATYLGASKYVCFRPEVDQYFLVIFEKPKWTTQRDPASNMDVVQEEKTGSGQTIGFDKGIPDGKTMPNLVFSGKWQHLPDSLGGDIFSAE